MKLKFLPSTDSNEKRTMYSKIDNRILMIGNDTDELNQKRFDSLLHNYQIGLELIFDYVSGMHYM